MSGRKDYEYQLEQRRLARLASELAARRAERTRATKRRLEQARQNAQVRTATLGQQQREANRLRRQQRAEQARQAVETKQRAATQLAKQIRASQQQQHATEAAAQQKAREQELARELEQALKEQAEQQQRTDADAAKQEALQSEMEQQMQTVMQWRDSFAESEDVRNFAAADLHTWQASTQELIDQLSQSPATEDGLKELQRFAAQAEHMEEAAGSISDRFYARNQVLADIMGSLKEIGFFVQDPEYADPDRPDGAVLIRASRGDQTMMTEVDLDKTVRSDWQGVHGEYCTDGFFEYVKAMSQRGVDITPTDPALKPRLLQKGAKDLPGQQERSRGQS